MYLPPSHPGQGHDFFEDSAAEEVDILHVAGFFFSATLSCLFMISSKRTGPYRAQRRARNYTKVGVIDVGATQKATLEPKGENENKLQDAVLLMFVLDLFKYIPFLLDLHGVWSSVACVV